MHVNNIYQKPLNIKIDISKNQTLLIIGNIPEALEFLHKHFFIRENIYTQITEDKAVQNLLEESSHYVLPPDIAPENMKLREATQDDLDDFNVESQFSSGSVIENNTSLLFSSKNNSQAMQNTTSHLETKTSSIELSHLLLLSQLNK